MQQPINQGNVQWIVQIITNAIGDGRFNQGEVLLALAESMGRLIVNMSDNPVAGTQATQIMLDHVKTTLHAGFTSKGFNMGKLN